ncbi:hypothetical protein O1611_g751 [Lasiodiplodia mahajangana]|uniref:Uncharacterized protein n=1 Tax=Lasiodiplodia mahajangana TaxID=1108764 RepID=A0ACC2JZN2_9PEZI|nr:hypothetical protein O1611_g751 [Lasiodiplodia mahajangana]
MLSTAKHSSVVTASERSLLLESEYGPMTNSAMPKYASISSRAARGRKAVPQTIGHRGFKAAAPENTMAAFKAAAEAGVEAIETDLHLTHDGVVVLCHDETLERCYGNKSKVRDLDWSEIAQLRTLREPHQPMPRLIDLLKYLDEPGQQDIWLMLDIKRPLLQSLVSDPGILGLHHAAGTMLRHALASPCGTRFLRDMNKLGIPVHVWTVNEENWMEWSVRKQLSGVITDEVSLFHEVCKRIGGGEGQAQATNKNRRKATGLESWFLYRTVRFWGEMTLLHFFVTIFLAREWLNGSPRHRISKALNG